MYKESEYKLYSVGIAAVDLDKEDYTAKELEVFPIELMSLLEGDISGKDMKPYTIQVTDEEDIPETAITIKKKMTFKATWLPGNSSNRITAPNIKKGETVMLYKYADTDKYYWTTFDYERDIRGKERVTTLYGNTDKEVLTMTNSHYVTIDAFKNFMELYFNGGESNGVEYRARIDGTKNIASFKDSKGNYISLESNADTEKHHLNKALKISTEKFCVQNSTTELIALMAEWLDACIADIGTGNLGIPVPRDNGTINWYKSIKERLLTFKTTFE